MPPTAVGPAQKQPLNFLSWLKMYGITKPSELSPHYDYKAAFEAGVGPGVDPHETEIDPRTNAPYLHWDSRFKKDTHPHRFIPSDLGIFDSKYSSIVPSEAFARIATPDQKLSVKNGKYSLPKDEVERYMSDPQRLPTPKY